MFVTRHIQNVTIVVEIKRPNTVEHGAEYIFSDINISEIEKEKQIFFLKIVYFLSVNPWWITCK